MSTVRLGIDRRYWIGPAVATLAELTGLGTGFENLSRTRTRDHTDTLSDGIIAGRLGRFVAADHVVACASNSSHDPALRDIHAHRRHYRYQDNPSAMQYTGQAIAGVSLTLNPQNGLCNWALNMVGDGIPTASAAAADNRTPQAVASYSAYMADLYWCTDSLTVPLNSSWETACQLQGTGSPARTRVQAAGTGEVGLTADATAGGFAVSIGLRAGAMLDAMLNAPEGWFVIRRKDADFGYCIPGNIRSAATTSATGAAIIHTVQISGREGSLPVAAAPADADTTLTAGQVGYLINTAGGGLDYATTGTLDDTGDTFILAGPPYVRDNS